MTFLLFLFSRLTARSSSCLEDRSPRAASRACECEKVAKSTPTIDQLYGGMNSLQPRAGKCIMVFVSDLLRLLYPLLQRVALLSEILLTVLEGQRESMRRIKQGPKNRSPQHDQTHVSMLKCACSVRKINPMCTMQVWWLLQIEFMSLSTV